MVLREEERVEPGRGEAWSPRRASPAGESPVPVGVGAPGSRPQLHEVLRAGAYLPAAMLRRCVPRAEGKKRRLGIPTVRHRVVQMAAKLVLAPIFEADLRQCPYHPRIGRSATDAPETPRKLGGEWHNHVLDGDIRDHFGSIDHERLMERGERRISDRRVRELLLCRTTRGLNGGFAEGRRWAAES